MEAKKLAQRLREVTGHTDHYFSQDIRVTARLLAHLLAFESHQQGFGLTATQDAHFNEVGALCSGSQPRLPAQVSALPERERPGSLPWSSSHPPLLAEAAIGHPSDSFHFSFFPTPPCTEFPSLFPSRICCGLAPHCLLQRLGPCGKHWGSGHPGVPPAVQGWCSILRNMRPHSPRTWSLRT